MPPKGSTKAKVEQPEPETPKPKAKAKRRASPDPDTPTPRKKAKTPVKPVYVNLATEERAANPIDVSYEGVPQAKLVKSGAYEQMLRLESLMPFSVVKTIMITEGALEGSQAIIIQPAKAFPFLKLPEKVRGKVYDFVFAPNGVVGNDLILEARRATKDVFAKSYSEGSKNRVAILAVNKQIYEEATPKLYEQRLRFGDTTTLADFLSERSDVVKARLHSISIKTVVKNSIHNAMRGLNPAVNLTRLHFDTAVSTSSDPKKAANEFWKEACKFLEAVSAKKGEKGSGVDILSFGRTALTHKDSKGSAQPWTEAMREEFLDALRAKMV